MSQKPLFPMTYVNITQKWGTGTHKYGYPIDNAGKDARIDNCFAPFDGIVRKLWDNGNSVWLESLDKVKFADGSIDYAVFMATHDNNISDLKHGQKIKQGKVFYQEGTAGQATGNHVHMECGKGKFTGTGWGEKPNGQWVINRPIRPTALFWLNNRHRIIQTLGLKFKQEEEMITKQGVYVAFRFYWGRDPNATEYKRYVGKVSFDKLCAALNKSSGYKKLATAAAAGDLNIVSHLPGTLRSAYKPKTVDGYKPLGQEVYIKE
jgi:hypothetical protein